MGAFRREARTRTVGVLWQNVYCVVEVFYWRRSFWRVVEMMSTVHRLPTQELCGPLSTRTITAVDRNTDGDSELDFCPEEVHQDVKKSSG
jgi:hypothetical protein